MPILNYTTKVSASKTISEIQHLLGTRGASKVSVDYLLGIPSAIGFELVFREKPLSFRLPCNTKGIIEVLRKQKVPASLRTEEHAARARVAWRIVKDWIYAQVALIEAGQADMVQVFMPYLVDNNGMTLYQAMLEGKGPLQLTAGAD